MRLLSQRVELRPGWKIYSMYDTTLLPRSIADNNSWITVLFPSESHSFLIFFFSSPIILAATVGVGKWVDSYLPSLCRKNVLLMVTVFL